MARGGYEHAKVLPGPTMPYFSTHCGHATPKTTLQPFQGWPAAVCYPLEHHTPYAYVFYFWVKRKRRRGLVTATLLCLKGFSKIVTMWTRGVW
jgi:hypothetical protein